MIKKSLFLIIGVFIFNLSMADVNINEIQKVVDEAYQQSKSIKDGKNADYIKALSEVNPNLLGISIATVDGKVINVGDSDAKFSIQSISKIFSLALAAQDRGMQKIYDKVGVNATGLRFNDVAAIEMRKSNKPAGNPLVNAGAIETVSLIKGKGNEKFDRLLDYMSSFANNKLEINQKVYESEASSNTHNKAIAELLQSYDSLFDEPMETTDVYTKACSINVSSKDLAIMGSVLANGGLNPITGKQLLSKKDSARVLAVMSTYGLYETTGDWMFWTGVPAKSGVGGGLLAIIPGKMAISVFSPPLDESGNSVKGQAAIKYIVDKLQLNLFTPKDK